ncbi:MAG: hypothetical protein CMI36_14385 [Owenweeksia sp.]|nr:hypothetical protein [Owenweeksia sp.]MBG00181.1 hypothetical protein [Owenweeksia sp.]|tara:strand:+ start:944 stop:2041 length:1098 start_codon:yes stop_codon:yes gene_type:complete
MRKYYTLCCILFACLSMSGQLIINEVLYDPSNDMLEGDANGDGVYDQEEDSFIEFYNTSTTNFDASGYEIWDDSVANGGQLRYVIPAGTWVPPGGALVVFGGGTLTGSFGNAVVLKTDSAVGMNLNNSGEVILIKDPNGQTVLTFDSDALSNNPNESYTRNPDITGLFEQHADNTPILFSPGTKIDGTPFDTVFVVMDISVQGQGGASTISTPGGTLQMEAIVMPTFADDTTVSWSVPAGNVVATVSASGLLTATGNGTVWVTATANDGTGISDSAEVTITNQNIGLNEPVTTSLAVYPNPANDKLFINGPANLSHVKIFNLSGQLLMQTEDLQNGISVANLQKGIYILKADSGQEDFMARFSKL